MEMRQLRYFIAVAEEKNLSRAALRLRLSQPPLTRQIRQLEAEIGATLFDRNSRGVEITEAGRLFLNDARTILGMTARASSRARSAQEGQLGCLDVAVFGSVMFDRLPRVLSHFRKTHPGVELVFHTMNKGDQIEALRQGRIQAGFSRLTANYPDIASEPLQRERLMVALPKDHVLAKRAWVSIPDLASVALILFASGTRPNFADLVYGLFDKHGLVPTVSQGVEDAVTGIALVAAGFGACLVPASASCVRVPGVVYRAVRKVPPDLLDVNCMYRTDDTAPVTAAFLRVVRMFARLRPAPP